MNKIDGSNEGSIPNWMKLVKEVLGGVTADALHEASEILYSLKVQAFITFVAFLGLNAIGFLVSAAGEHWNWGWAVSASKGAHLLGTFILFGFVVLLVLRLVLYFGAAGFTAKMFSPLKEKTDHEQLLSLARRLLGIIPCLVVSSVLMHTCGIHNSFAAWSVCVGAQIGLASIALAGWFDEAWAKRGIAACLLVMLVVVGAYAVSPSFRRSSAELSQRFLGNDKLSGTEAKILAKRQNELAAIREKAVECEGYCTDSDRRRAAVLERDISRLQNGTYWAEYGAEADSTQQQAAAPAAVVTPAVATTTIVLPPAPKVDTNYIADGIRADDPTGAPGDALPTEVGADIDEESPEQVEGSL